MPDPYAEVTEEKYATVAAALFSVTRHPLGTLLLSGPCPRCSVTIAVPVVTSIFKSGGTNVSEDESSLTTKRYETIVCNCEEVHPGRPEGLSGCGAYWQLEIVEDGQ